MSIFEPGFLRAALAYWRAGKLPAGHDGAPLLRRRPSSRPTAASGSACRRPRPSLDAYLELLGDCPLPWSVAVLGGDLFATDLPALALERGGHLRVGLEDHKGRTVTNEELVAEAVPSSRSPAARSRRAPRPRRCSGCSPQLDIELARGSGSMPRDSASEPLP